MVKIYRRTSRVARLVARLLPYPLAILVPVRVGLDTATFCEIRFLPLDSWRLDFQCWRVRVWYWFLYRGVRLPRRRAADCYLPRRR